MVEWPLHDAKNRLSTLVDKALTDGPQTITRHGEPAVVVLAVSEFRRLTGREPTLEDLLLAAPEDVPESLPDLADLIGPRSRGREIKLG
jgi:antitoxin Phd